MYKNGRGLLIGDTTDRAKLNLIIKEFRRWRRRNYNSSDKGAITLEDIARFVLYRENKGGKS